MTGKHDLRVRMEEDQHAALLGWSQRAGVPVARLVRRLLLLLPYYQLTNTDLIVLKMPAQLGDDPDRLDQFLEDACQEIRQHYKTR